jgi:hypothetical protein
MTTQLRSTSFSLEAAEAISRFQNVYINSSQKWAVATTTTPPAIATALDTVASGGTLAAELFSSGGSLKMIAAEAITVGSRVYQAAAGKVADTVAGAYMGVALDAASADGDVIEVLLPQPGEAQSIGHYRAFTADATLGVSLNGFTITNLAASGTITLTLPTGVPAGTWFRFGVQAAQQLRIKAAASDALMIAGTTSADAAYAWADDEGESVVFVADTNNNWLACNLVGTWTVV